MRRYKRRKAGYPCVITFENGEQRLCRLLNVSPRGGRIVGIEPSLPKGAIILTSWDQGRSVRTSRVVWMNGSSAGVEFIADPKARR